ncbi:unnamed protein product [Cuscuta europaea]|uniref:SHSP domain-containing protein n=1 Tax=Cuscuta europaea TaxID=41803 RepID=A0A9P0Z7I6_CUSEU|nr:unnamed protein product [Cuscuta europaea]
MNLNPMSGVDAEGRRRSSAESVYEEVVPLFEWNQDSTAHYWLFLHLPGFRREDVRVEVKANGLIKIGGEKNVNGTKFIWFEQFYKAPQNSKPEDSKIELVDGVLKLTIPKLAEKVHAATPAKSPIDEDDSTRDKGKNVNGSGDYYHSHSSVKSTIENAPAAAPAKTPEDEGDRNHDKGKMVNGNGECPNKSEVRSSEEEHWDVAANGEKKSCNCLAKIANKLKNNMEIFLVAILAFSVGVLVSHNKLRRANTNEKVLAKLDNQNHSEKLSP